MSEVKTVEFEGPCPFLTCLKTEKHTHPICPVCGAVRYGNLFCEECRNQMEPGGLSRDEWDEYVLDLKKRRG
ncbi:MAG TPA: hypothetical protein DCZ10_15960 [Pelotomaculum sp.]|nr:hypothetical protein [Pelotomaculum sp.]